MRKWLILFLALCIFIPLSVKAQGTVALDTLKVQLWSEHDQPSMLVIYEFNLTSDTLIPATMDIRIPKDANIIAVAVEDNGNLLDLLDTDFKGPVEDGEWQVITFFIKSRNTYHLEYYQPLTRDGVLRTFNYEWTGEYPVNNFSLEMQVPADSTGVKSNPTIPFVQSQTVLSGGAMKAGLEAGQTYQVQLQYSRTSDELSAPPPSSQVEPAAPLDANAEGRVTLDNLPYILGGIGAILILAAIYYSWHANSLRLSKPQKRQRHPQEAGTQTYCHECGARAQAGDRFCRTCGSKLRTG